MGWTVWLNFVTMVKKIINVTLFFLLGVLVGFGGMYYYLTTHEKKEEDYIQISVAAYGRALLAHKKDMEVYKGALEENEEENRVALERVAVKLTVIEKKIMAFQDRFPDIYDELIKNPPNVSMPIVITDIIDEG